MPDDLKNDLYPKRYGAWGGNPKGSPPDFTRCCERVSGSDAWDHGHQCYRKRGYGPDAAYCKQHDPDVVRARDERRNAAYRARIDEDNKLRRLQRHGPAILEALQKIADGHNDPRTLAKETIASFERQL